jgi:hypothetical protein
LLGSRDRNLAAAAKRRGNKEVPRKLGILRLVHHTSIAVGTLDRTIWTLENGKNTNYESERAGASRHRRIQRNDFVEMNVKSEDLGQ